MLKLVVQLQILNPQEVRSRRRRRQDRKARLRVRPRRPGGVQHVSVRVPNRRFGSGRALRPAQDQQDLRLDARALHGRRPRRWCTGTFWKHDFCTNLKTVNLHQQPIFCEDYQVKIVFPTSFLTGYTGPWRPDAEEHPRSGEAEPEQGLHRLPGREPLRQGDPQGKSQVLPLRPGNPLQLLPLQPRSQGKWKTTAEFFDKKVHSFVCEWKMHIFCWFLCL